MIVRKKRWRIAARPSISGLLAKLALWRTKGGNLTVVRPAARVFALVFTKTAKGYFEITASGAREIESAALPTEGAVFYVFEGSDKDLAQNDRRVALPKKMRARAAREHVLEIVTEKARTIRSPKHPRIVYARDLLSLAKFNGNTVIPGAALVDNFIDPETTEGVIAPIVLQDSAGNVAAVLIYTVIPNAVEGLSKIERLQFTKQPQTSVEELVAEYRRTAHRALKIDSLLTSEIVAPTDKELFELAPHLPAYATENDVFGVPLSSALKGACVASAVIAVISIGANVVMGAEAGYLAVSANRASTERDELQQKISDTFTKNIRVLAAAMSIDEAAAIQAAKDVWRPNSLVQIDCTTSSCAIGLSASVMRRDGQMSADGGAQLVSQVVDKEMVTDVLTQPAPIGYRKKEIAITGDGNVVTVTFEQQNTDTPVRRLLPH